MAKPKIEVVPPPAKDEDPWWSKLPLYRGSPPRPLFFHTVGEKEREALIEKGYNPVSLFELPRGTPQEEINYLLAKAQGIEEGTITVTEAEFDALELEMKANKMLGNRSSVARITINAKAKEVAELLSSWRDSRHTLRGNSTIDLSRQLEIAPIKGIKKGGKVKKGKADE